MYRGITSLAFLTLLTLVGCRWTGARLPISRSLATSRQLSQQGVAAMERCEWGRAEELLSKAVETCKDDPDAHHHFAEVLWHQGKQTEAIAEMVEAVELSDTNAALRVRLAEMRHSAGQLRLAERSVQHALDLDPRLPTAWAVRGRIMRDLGQLPQALADFHRALGLSPGDPNIQLEIAEIHRRLNQPERALAALHSALGSYTPGEEPQRLLYLEGLAYAAAGRYEDAVESYSAACLRAEPTAEILYRMAEAEALAGRADRAAEAAQEALHLDPEHRPSQVLLGRIRVVPSSGGVKQR